MLSLFYPIHPSFFRTGNSWEPNKEDDANDESADKEDSEVSINLEADGEQVEITMQTILDVKAKKIYSKTMMNASGMEFTMEVLRDNGTYYVKAFTPDWQEISENDLATYGLDAESFDIEQQIKDNQQFIFDSDYTKVTSEKIDGEDAYVYLLDVTDKELNDYVLNILKSSGADAGTTINFEFSNVEIKAAVSKEDGKLLSINMIMDMSGEEDGVNYEHEDFSISFKYNSINEKVNFPKVD